MEQASDDELAEIRAIIERKRSASSDLSRKDRP
jgi:hypothetical protein